VLFPFDFEEVSLVARFLQVFLVLMLKLYVIFHLVFDELVLIRECLLQQVNAVLLLVEVAVDARVLMLIASQFLLEEGVFFGHLVDVGLHLQHLAVDLGKPALVVTDGFP
jgi:hypothetical protein